MLRSYRARFLLVHIGDPSSNQATTLESQVIHMIQGLFGQTLSFCRTFRTLPRQEKLTPLLVPATTPRPPSSEQVAAFDRTTWSRSIGIPGRNPRNPHQSRGDR